MTNEMKLLMAFIEASGFEVEEVTRIETGLIQGLAWSDEVTDYKVTKKDDKSLSIIKRLIDGAEDINGTSWSALEEAKEFVGDNND